MNILGHQQRPFTTFLFFLSFCKFAAQEPSATAHSQVPEAEHLLARHERAVHGAVPRTGMASPTCSTPGQLLATLEVGDSTGSTAFYVNECAPFTTFLKDEKQDTLSNNRLLLSQFLSLKCREQIGRVSKQRILNKKYVHITHPPSLLLYVNSILRKGHTDLGDICPRTTVIAAC